MEFAEFDFDCGNAEPHDAPPNQGDVADVPDSGVVNDAEGGDG